MSRHHIYLPDDLWDRVQRAALEEAVRRGKQVSASEWIRETIQQRLGDDVAGEEEDEG